MKNPVVPERILVVDDEQSILEAMAEAIRMLNFTVSTAQHGDEAWKKFEEEKPDVVVTDVHMPHRDGLALTSQIKVFAPSCPVIVVTGFGSEEAAISALKAGASDYLVKPFQFSALRQAVERACTLVRAKKADEQIVPVVDQVDGTFILDNMPEMVGSVVNAALRTLSGCMSEKQILGVRVALQELLINAMEHGNLNISSDEKRRAILDDTYEELLETRRDSPAYRNRRVRLSFCHDVSMGTVEFRVHDEGDGFDWKCLVNRNEDQLLSASGSGRGIFLVRTLIHDIRYVGKGNEVVLHVTHAIDEEKVHERVS
ncbi:MAG: response regulator [Nitrospirales bacterium]|nr:response regulator [Nitrospira sp.]MDR4502318.1 response regulator [Nitrospirales bacterium]